MLDVLHYYYEVDMTPDSVEQANIRDSLRKAMYPLLYDKEYEYGEKESEDPYTSPPEGTVQPYIPPTSPEDLQAILGPPMGQ